MKRLTLLLALALLLGFGAAPLTRAEPRVKTYVVNTKEHHDDAWPGDGYCDHGSLLNCSLRAAVQEANADGVDSIIQFSRRFTETDHIHGCDATGTPFVPALTADRTRIDASDLWDTADDRPGVEMSGDCCLLTISSRKNIVYGMMFSGTDNTGICIHDGDRNTIGSTRAGERNVFILGTGVQVKGSSPGNVIKGNYFGTIDGVYTVSSYEGVALEWATYTWVEDNVFGGHSEAGIHIYEGTGNRIVDNNIGVDAQHNSPLPNKVGLKVTFSDQNVIGPSNWIGGNTDQGIYLWQSEGNIIWGNTIGHCNYNLGNGSHGIHLHNTHDTELDGNSVSCNDGNGVYISSADSPLIHSNTIGGNGHDGIHVSVGSGTQIGGAHYKGNTIGGNGSHGVHLNGEYAREITVMGNDIGLSSGSWDDGNQGYGVLLENGAHDNRIGGLAPGEGNWIAFNDQDGIRLSGSYTNVVVGNVIGAPRNWGWEAPNGWHGIGIYSGARANWIGLPLFGNIILSSDWSGIAIIGSDRNQVWSNFIGTDGAGVHWGNSYYGLDIVNSDENALAGNEVAYNGTSVTAAGVKVAGGSYNWISLNSIHDNNGPGISLVDGGNGNLAAPTISQASCQGTVAGTACAGCTVEIFSDGADEGRVCEASTTAHATTGAFSWNGTVNGPNVTATAIDSTDNTSPFATPVSVGLCNAAPTAAFTTTPTSGDTCTFFGFDASASSDPEDATSALQVRWDWDNNGFYDTGWTTTKTTVRLLGSPTLQTIRLQVQDSGGLTDATTRVMSLGGATCQLYRSYVPLVVDGGP